MEILLDIVTVLLITSVQSVLITNTLVDLIMN
jgi:hypothetical protein